MHTNIKINEDRLWHSLNEMALIGATEKGGVNRQNNSEWVAPRCWSKYTISSSNGANGIKSKSGRVPAIAPITSAFFPKRFPPTAYPTAAPNASWVSESMEVNT